MNQPLFTIFYILAGVCFILLFLPSPWIVPIAGTCLVLSLLAGILSQVYRLLFETKSMHIAMERIAQRLKIPLFKEQHSFMRMRGEHKPKTQAEVLRGMVAGKNCQIIFCYPSISAGGNGNVYSKLQI
jgi:hypothetical protein